VVVAVERKPGIRRNSSQDGFQKPGDAGLHRFRIGASEALFECGAPPALIGGHGTLATQGAVGEVIEEPAVGTGREVGVEREVLGVLERLEAIDDERFTEVETLQAHALEEQTVSTESGNVSGDGGMGGSQSAGNLAQGGAFGDEDGDAQEQVPSSQPVGGAKGRAAEAASAVGAAVVLEATAV
jgi:hypothetical protein